MLFGLVAGCTEELEKDEPLPFPDGGLSDQDGGMTTDADGGVCTPDPCDGLIDKSRGGGPDKGLCISFDKEDLVSLGQNRGASIVDFNLDGKPDIFLLKDGGANQMFRNDGGIFTEISGAIGLNFGGDSRHAAWNDYDADGDIDLFLAGSNGSHLYKNNGGIFQSLPVSVGIHDPNPGKAAQWIGADLFLATENGTRYYKRLSGDSFQETALSLGLDDPGDGSAIAVADYEGDGRADIYLANSTGMNRLFRQKPDGTYESVELATMTTGLGNSTDAAWVSYSGETLPSLYVPNFFEGNQFFENQQDGTFVEKAGLLGIRDPGQTTRIAWGDFLAEGRPALFLGRWEQPNLLRLPNLGPMGEVLGYTEIGHPLGMDLTGRTVAAGWFHSDDDGKLDLLVVMADGGIFLYRNQTKTVRICEED